MPTVALWTRDLNELLELLVLDFDIPAQDTSCFVT